MPVNKPTQAKPLIIIIKSKQINKLTTYSKLKLKSKQPKQRKTYVQTNPTKRAIQSKSKHQIGKPDKDSKYKTN